MDSNRDAACSPEDHALLTRQNTPHVMRYRYAKCGVFVMVCSAENQSIPIADSSRPRSSLRTAVVVTDNSVLHPRVSSCANPPPSPSNTHRTHHAHPPAQPGQRLDQSPSRTNFHACVCMHARWRAHTQTRPHRYKVQKQKPALAPVMCFVRKHGNHGIGAARGLGQLRPPHPARFPLEDRRGPALPRGVGPRILPGAAGRRRTLGGGGAGSSGGLSKVV